MKNIILFASRHGNTERILTELVNRASASASGELLLKPVRKTPRKDLEDADRIAVGGPVYMGKMRGEVAAFLSRNRALLLSKPLALFAVVSLAGMKPGRSWSGFSPPTCVPTPR
jgi:menaquinone-dependent protoporphyrinogen IX oxidase